MRQTIALLLDGYRELNAKKLFWITLGLSGLVVVAFGITGINERGVSLLWWTFPILGFNSKILSPALFYKVTFLQFGIGFWLAWLASILALISTSSIFPDFLSNGSIELVLSKPIGRLRLFLTKYLMGLLFVTLQVGVFTTACFFVIGFRGGAWLPSLFLAIPIVVAFFSYLACFNTLMAMYTKSTIASLLSTLLFWFLLFGLNATDSTFIAVKTNSELQVKTLTRQIERMEKTTSERLRKNAPGTGDSATTASDSPAASVTADGPKDADRASAATGTKEPTDLEMDAANPILAYKRHQLVDKQKDVERWTWWSNLFVDIKTVLPKTSETVELLSRNVMNREDIEIFRSRRPAQNVDLDQEEGIPIDHREMTAKIEDTILSRSPYWVIGTSLAFEAFVLVIAGWMFCRRDF